MGRAPARWPQMKSELCLSLPPPKGLPTPRPTPLAQAGSPGDADCRLCPAQALRITAAGSAVSASWTSCALRGAAVRVPSWTAPTRSWPASQATSPNTSLTCKYYLHSHTHPVTPSQREHGLQEAAPSRPSHMDAPWLASTSSAENIDT